MNSLPQQPGYFRKIATVLIRVVAVGFIVRGLCLVLYQLGWWSDAWQGWSVPVFDLVSGAALWVFSPRIAGLVARGLDESG